MKINVITLIPELYDTYFNFSVFYNALKDGIFSYELKNLRDFGLGIHKKVDDYPYGGGKGMILRVEPLVNCLNSFEDQGRVIFFSPAGRKLDISIIKEYAKLSTITIVNGRYEGVDERFIENYVDDIISIGDFILTGGDPAALTFIDALLRHVPGFLDKEALLIESFEENLLEYPQYTRPEIFEGLKVPEILLSGNHEQIKKWRDQKRIEFTLKHRPDLINK